MDIKSNGKGDERVQLIRDELKKKEPTTLSDELLRQHLRKLRIAWNPMAMPAEKVA